MARHLEPHVREAMIRLNDRVNPSFCSVCGVHKRKEHRDSCENDACPFDRWRKGNGASKGVESG